MPAADEVFERFTRHFTRQAVAELISKRQVDIARGLLAGVARLVCDRDLLTALNAGQIPAKRVRFYLDRRRIDLHPLRISGDDSVPATVTDKLVFQGATLVFNHLDRMLEPLHRLACLIGDELQQRIEISAILSVTDRSGLSAHHDPVNLFVVQLEGQKEWTLLGPPIREGLPMDGFSGEEGAPHTIMLRAGDVMFLPAGQRHQCSPCPEGALHLSIIIHAPSGALAGAGLSNAIAGDPHMLRPYLAFAHGGDLAARVADYRARLHELVDELDLQALLDDPRNREQRPLEAHAPKPEPTA